MKISPDLRTVVISLFSLLVVLSFAAGHKRLECLSEVGADTASVRDSVDADSVLPVEHSQAAVPDTVFSFRPAGTSVVRDSAGKEDARIPEGVGDSLPQVTDTLSVDSVKKRSSGLDAPVNYKATDSLVYDAETGLAILYGQAQVGYQDMQLDAAQITMNMDSSLVHAQGRRDSTGAMEGNPIYKQGSEDYESEKMSFNFKTKKGFISNVSTQQGNGFLVSQNSKRAADGTLYLEKATYTTCDAEHPHFYFKVSRGKARPGKDIVFGPTQLYVADVPTPIALPYGYFPFSKSYSSGFIMPTIGDETSRGFYLRDGGYYFALSDYMDLKLLGEIYTKGSWGLSGEMNYRKRYHYNGNFYISYINTVEGEKNMPDYSVTKSLKVQWTHTKDSKASPNTSFSARVNFASENYERKNIASLYNPLAYTQSTRASSVSMSHTFPSIGLTLSGSFNVTQNMRDSSLAVTLPDLSISLNRLYPFRRKRMAGKERWYEKISLSYTGQLSNSITTKEDRLFKSNLIKDWRNGMQHRIPIDATFQLFKYINVSPNFSFRDIMYTNRIMRSWDTDKQEEVRDTTYGFYNLYDWSVGVSANTTLYGFYKPWKKLFGSKIIAVRHVFKPNISFSYAPDFTADRFGYTDSYVRTEADGTVSTVTYSPYQHGIFSYPSGTKQGLVSMSISNNVEMKVRSDRDSTGERKISLIDELSGTLSYNMAAKQRPWSDLNMRVRLKLTKNYTFSLAALFATYAYAFNDRGQVVLSDRTEWSYGRFGRFQGMAQNISYTFNNQSWQKLCNLFSGKRGRENTENGDAYADNAEVDADEANLDPDIKASQRQKKQKVKAKVDADGYMAFSIPWSLSLSYGISMFEDRSKDINVRRMRYPYSFSQSLNASGFIRIADGWNINFTSGYDFEMKRISMTTASLSRDLHCFEMSCSVVLRPYTSFNFSFRARSGELADVLKWDKRSSYSTNIDWY